MKTQKTKIINALGFSLVEVMTVTVLSVAVISAIAMASRAGIGSSLVTANKTASIASARSNVDAIAKELSFSNISDNTVQILPCDSNVNSPNYCTGLPPGEENRLLFKLPIADTNPVANTIFTPEGSGTARIKYGANVSNVPTQTGWVEYKVTFGPDGKEHLMRNIVYSDTVEICGNGECESHETVEGCAVDCVSCLAHPDVNDAAHYDGRCDRPYENETNCLNDCPRCGNGVCDREERCIELTAAESGGNVAPADDHVINPRLEEEDDTNVFTSGAKLSDDDIRNVNNVGDTLPREEIGPGNVTPEIVIQCNQDCCHEYIPDDNIGPLGFLDLFTGTAYAEDNARRLSRATTLGEAKSILFQYGETTPGVKNGTILITLDAGKDATPTTQRTSSKVSTTVFLKNQGIPMTGALCGDGICSDAENSTECPEDCNDNPANCDNDNICEAAENCPTCPYCPPCAPRCGDQICNGSETSGSCPQDCPTCPDGYCNSASENCSICPLDCGACPPPPVCFLAGTAITMSNGSQKPIELVEIGDEVLSFDENTGEFKPGKVTEIFEHNSGDYLIINGNLKVTSNHHFLSDGQWVEIGSLKTGDVLLNNKKENEPIQSIEKMTEKVKVYNIEVDSYHNYVAGGYVAHNKPRPRERPSENPIHIGN
ncbi:MAG: Hint domain-containing protein [Candidatus Omnitrophota bacterium]